MDFRAQEVSIAYSILSTSGKFSVSFHNLWYAFMSHEDIHETVGRIVDLLEFIVGVGVSGDCIALIQCHERHDFGLKIVPCCSMAD